MTDGDTIVCSDERIRLLLIDTPEIEQEPFGLAAKLFLESLIPPGTEIRVELDVQERDQYRRILAYLYLSDGRMVNEEVARSGYAVALVYPPNVRYVERIRKAVEEARARRLGLWATSAFECSPRAFRHGECEVPWVPPGPAVSTGQSTAKVGEVRQFTHCDPSYPDVCIPRPPPDLDCGEIPYRRFRVAGADPHRFDGDKDGIGCES